MIKLDDDGRGTGNILFQCMLTPDGFTDTDGFYRAKVYSPGTFVIQTACFTELAASEQSRNSAPL